jgi:hypothetical protein
MPKNEMNAEDIELEFKRLQLEDLRETVQARRDRKERLASDRAKQLEDFKKSERQRLRRQEICQHRKGGRDNRFHKGTDANHSIITNTYPDGRILMMCTRCWKEVEKPNAKLKKEDPKLYAAMWQLWQEWQKLPTDNTPSGTKMFELVA